MRIAWLGTGLLGRPMAARLCAAGHAVFAWNRTREKMSPLREVGATIAGTPAEAVAHADCVCLMLRDAAAIASVLFPGTGAPELGGRNVIQMGTIGPRESIDLAARVRDRGGEYLEAPVLGSIQEAENRRLIVMVGSTSQQYARWRELLECFGPEPLLIGPVGSAAALKLALNQLIAGLTTVFAFSLGFVRRSGLDVETFMRILRQSALYAPTFDKKMQRMLSRDFTSPNFPVEHLIKDVRLVRTEGESLGLASETLSAIETILERAIALGHARSDYSALYEAVDSPSGKDPASGRDPLDGRSRRSHPA